MAGGIDFIKDDELQADGSNCRFDDRVRAVMRIGNEAADRTGKKVMVAFNLSRQSRNQTSNTIAFEVTVG